MDSKLDDNEKQSSTIVLVVRRSPLTIQYRRTYLAAAVVHSVLTKSSTTSTPPQPPETARESSMALVASHDWSNDMDSRQQRPHNTTDPTNAGAAAAQQSPSPTAYAQPPYGFAHPQQTSPAWHMGGMNQMNIAHGQPNPGYFPQMQFYPQHYPHPQQQPPPQMHAHPQGSPYGQPPQMFDPNAQFAQWAYQQMMFNAQQSHQLSLSPPQPQPQQQQQRSRSGSHSGSNAGTPTNEYYQAPFSHSRFQQSSPPASQPTSNGATYQGFHPYRRPERGDRRPHTESPPLNAPNNNSIPFQPPYARSDAAGSTTSVNSTSSTSHRSRTNSGTSANGSARPPINQQNSSKHTPRQSSTSSTTSTPRSGSSSSSTVSSSTLSTPGSTITAPRTTRPSPLSQGAILSGAERRKSRDDSDLAAMFNSAVNLGDSSPSTPMARSGLKGRLRRALSFNAAQTLREEEEESSRANGKKKEKAVDEGTEGEGDVASMATKKTKKSLRMFNSRFNASTDNISLSSTVSSASVMIRKLGSMGKLARRNSLAGITSLFKDKDKDKNKDDDDDATDSKGKKSKGKGRKADASVSHATAEVDKTNEWSAPGMEGLSPAAKLARQHTLKSNAEAAARAKAQQEAQAAAAAAAASSSGSNGEILPTTWERNTATKHGVNMGGAGEDGVRLVIEEDFDEEDAEMRRSSNDFGSGSDEDSTWHGHGPEEEDTTVRMGGDRLILEDEEINNSRADDDDVLDEPWAQNCRRSIEKSRQPARGILKNSNSYQQGDQPIGPNAAFLQRVRANSYDSVPNHQSELGPLAHLPNPDPETIDGLHRHGSQRSTASTVKESATNGTPFLPPLEFETLAPSLSGASSSDGDKRSSVYNHPNLNNSEPTLSTIISNQPTLTHRSATTPAKRLAFAANLSIYDTFSATMYDRRSEPATWSRLTPALAQRIKEELNSYKMEEMEVHASSRIHTQFFV